MGIVVIGAVFVDIKGFPLDAYIPTGRNAGHIKYIHGGVSRNVVEDIANIELRQLLMIVLWEKMLFVNYKDIKLIQNMFKKFLREWEHG